VWPLKYVLHSSRERARERVSRHYFPASRTDAVAFIALETHTRKSINFKCALITRVFHFHWDVLIRSCFLPGDTRESTAVAYQVYTSIVYRILPYLYAFRTILQLGPVLEKRLPIPFRSVLSAARPMNAGLARANEFRYGKFYSCPWLYCRAIA